MKKFHKKSLALLVSVALLLTFAVSGTVAYLVDASGPVENQFKPASVTPSVTDSVSNNVKSNVVIKNSGTAKAYIRVAIVGYWCDDKNNVVASWDLSDPQQGTFDSLTGSNWITGSDGYYYYSLPVAPGAETGSKLFNSYTVGTSPVNGAHLVMNLVVQSIQAEPSDAVKAAWGVTVSPDGTISK